MTHPTDELSRVFAALADPTRRAILEHLACRESTVTELAEPFALTQQAVSKHLKVLHDARLITRRQHGRSRPCALAVDRLDAATDWVARNRRLWSDRHDRLAEHLAELRDGKEARG